MKSFFKSKKYISAILCMTALTLTACGDVMDNDTLVVVDNSENTISYEFASVTRGDVVLSQKVRTTYRQQNEETIHFAVTGKYVDKVYVKEGDYVKKGDLLAELSAGNLERQIQDMEYSIARNELLLKYADENESLDIQQNWINYRDKMPSASIEEMNANVRKSYDRMREDYNDTLEMDRLKLDSLKKELSSCRVYAGIDGMVYKLKDGLEGSTSKVETTIMTIIDNTECLFEIEATEYADCFKEGEPVSMNISSGSSAGQYELIPYNIENWGDKQLFSILDGPMTSGIEVGTSGMLQFNLQKRENVLTLPKTAVNKADDKYYVYMVDENNNRIVRWVEAGLVGDSLVEIISGLEEGERVIQK